LRTENSDRKRLQSHKDFFEIDPTADGDTGRNVDCTALRLRVRNQKYAGDGNRHQQDEERDDQHICTLHDTALHELRMPCA
jgi:hypothetical protein